MIHPHSRIQQHNTDNKYLKVFIVFISYCIDNALECRAKYLLLVYFLEIIKLFFQEFCLRFFFFNKNVLYRG